MSALTDWFRGARGGLEERGSNDPVISLDMWEDMFQQMVYQGVSYTLPGATAEAIGANYRGLSAGAYKGDAVVFACCALRMSVFSQVRFQFRQIRNGKPGQLFGTPALGVLEKPWQGATTGDLLAKMIQHADLAGNWFGTNRYGGIRTLRPDWVSIIFGSDRADLEPEAYDPEAVVLGYAFKPGGPGSDKDPIIFDVSEVAHFAPTPDPEAQFRGMSWLTPVIREVMADKAMTEHKITFLERGGTPNNVVTFDTNDLSKFTEMIAKFSRDHEGVRGAYRTMYLAAGMDVKTVGTDMKQLDFKVVQGAGEIRIAAAAETPPVLVGLSEGLQGSSLNAGNYQAARRRFTDGPMRYLWANACGSLSQIVQVPGGAELWIDTSECAFLQEDEKDAAEIKQMDAQTLKTLVDAGFEPTTVVDAVTSGDMTRLVHTGLVSVQLLPPGTTGEPAAEEPVPALNGSNGKRHLDDDTDQIIKGFMNARQQPPEVNVRVDAPEITFPELAPPQVTFERGAIETTVEPADVHVIVESPPPAEPAQIQFVDGAIRVDAAPTPDVNVTIEAPPPAEVSMTVEAPPPADVRVQVDAPPPAEVNVQVDAPPPAEISMRVDAPPPAEVNVTVEPADVRVEPNITVEAPPPAEVTVNAELERPKRKLNIQRDADGNAVSYEEE